MNESKVALIHATPLAMQPVSAAFERIWPRVQRMNLLDDRLSQDLAAAGDMTDAMVRRIVNLARYATVHGGASGILFTCSAFGPAIEEAAHVVGVPTLKPNEAMFDEALEFCVQAAGEPRIGLLTTFAPAADSMCEELLVMARGKKQAFRMERACASGAMEALNAGDTATHDRLVLEAARTLAGCDVLMLGQFSMARCQAQVADVTRRPVLTSPDSAVRRLQAVLAASS